MNMLDTSLMVLVYATAVVLIVVGGFLIKLLYDLSKLAQAAKDTNDTIHAELEPTLKELKEVATSLKTITQNANTNISGIQKAITGAFNTSFQVGQKMKGLFSGLVKGLSVGFNLFRK